MHLDQVKMPLEIGATLPTKWRRLNDNYQMAVVIERRPLSNGDDTEYEYYMHYEGCECRTPILAALHRNRRRDGTGLEFRPAEGFADSSCTIFAANRRMDEWVAASQLDLKTYEEDLKAG